RLTDIVNEKDIWVYSYRMPSDSNSSIKMEVGIEDCLHIEFDETITKFEIMDGAPVRGETIPIRLFLGGFELTPTFRDVNKKFSTRYYLNLVLVDEENRRYFKQQEITIYRRRVDDGLPAED
ncbi:31390_t:CDS:2, partial [Racocetra persica]